jgi:streptomycin 6-kinase
VLHQESSLDRLLSLVAAEYGALLMLEGATGVRYDQVSYREVHDGEEATRLNFAAYWRQSNGNPAPAPFLALLRLRYPDLSAAPGVS